MPKPSRPTERMDHLAQPLLDHHRAPDWAIAVMFITALRVRL
jgi:hypothetical protein